MPEPPRTGVIQPGPPRSGTAEGRDHRGLGPPNRGRRGPEPPRATGMPGSTRSDRLSRLTGSTKPGAPHHIRHEAIRAARDNRAAEAPRPGNGKKRQTRGRFTCIIIIITGERKADTIGHTPCLLEAAGVSREPEAGAGQVGGPARSRAQQSERTSQAQEPTRQQDPGANQAARPRSQPGSQAQEPTRQPNPGAN